MLLYPKLPHSTASEIAVELISLEIPSLQQRWSNKHDAQYYSATGGNRASPEHLMEIRSKVMECAKNSGFPAPGSDDANRKFDSACAIELHRTMLISANEASSNEVWQFMTCVLLPEVVSWRFRTYLGVTLERYLGGSRNALRRLWWRAYLLHDPSLTQPYSLMESLMEDELVQITERPTISGNGNVARQICKNFIQLYTSKRITNRMEVMREGMKRIRRKSALISLDGMIEEQLSVMVDECFTSALEQMELSKKPSFNDKAKN
jgi:hypothetical protein